MRQKAAFDTHFAASMFIVASVKQPQAAVEIMLSEMRQLNADRRSAAIVRFYALWRHRYTCWLRLEENAHSNFRVIVNF